MGEDEPEAVSRRGLFGGWARGLADGLAEWVLPQLELQRTAHEELVARMRGVMDRDEPGEPADADGEGAVHPWRDLLQTPEEGDEAPPER